MLTITIPKKIAGNDDFVVLPRREYEALVSGKRAREFAPTVAQKSALKRAEQHFRKGKSLSYYELARKLGITG